MKEYLVSQPRSASAELLEPVFALRKRRSPLTLSRVGFHLVLLGLTLGSIFLTGVFWAQGPRQTFGEALQDPRVVSSGLAYGFTLVAILLAHEMGHYLACRYYKIAATLPYFIPAPPLIGTFGAFIRIKEAITSRRALFDIGIAGPLAGFAVAIPAALIGLLVSQPYVANPGLEGSSVYQFQDPLFFVLIQHAFHLPKMMMWNPIYFAAWVGMLATSLNLLPVGQLDGGHVVFALLGRRGHRVIAWSVFGLVCVLAMVAYSRYHWPGWFLYVGLLGLLLRLKHPPVADGHMPIDRRRLLVGAVGFIVFILSFMPFPITIT